jgi:hypothetical protein
MKLENSHFYEIKKLMNSSAKRATSRNDPPPFLFSPLKPTFSPNHWEDEGVTAFICALVC